MFIKQNKYVEEPYVSIIISFFWVLFGKLWNWFLYTGWWECNLCMIEGETYGASIWEIPELYGQSNAPQLEQLVSLNEHSFKIKWWVYFVLCLAAIRFCFFTRGITYTWFITWHTFIVLPILLCYPYLTIILADNENAFSDWEYIWPCWHSFFQSCDVIVILKVSILIENLLHCSMRAMAIHSTFTSGEVVA